MVFELVKLNLNNLSGLRDFKKIALFIILTLVSGLLPSIDISMAQERGAVVEEMPEVSAPTNASSAGEQKKELNSIPPNSDNLNPQSDTQVLTTGPISCSADTNPCIGTDGDDEMIGDAGTNSMHGKKGNDQMDGGEANDGIYGYEGDDTIIGGNGNDGIDGYEGDDTIDGSEGGDSIHGNQGNDNIDGGAGDDGIAGDEGNDKLRGGTGADYILGGNGDDVIWQNSEEQPTAPDGSKDIIDCGEGIDQVWLNQTEGDVGSSCEKVNDESIPGGTPSADQDNDYVPDYVDNCPKRSNNGQMDSDGDGIGDACDSDLDADSDGISDMEDNCMLNANPDQQDSNKDGVGDICSGDRIKVTFDSITIHNPHEPGFFSPTSDAEFDLSVYVQGKRLDLTDSSVNCVWAGVDFPPCGLGDSDWKETIRFNQPGQDIPAVITVDMPKGAPLSIFTVGQEVDECGRIPSSSFPEKFSQVEESIIKNPIADERYSAIKEIQKEANSYDCDSTFENDNEVLGTINEFYDPPTYGIGSHEVKSSSGDFTLRYTIGVTNYDLGVPDAFKLIHTDPDSGEKGSDPASDVSATFNKRVQEFSVKNNFGLWLTTAGRILGTNVDGTTSLSSDGKTVIFNPDEPLLSGTSYTSVLRSRIATSDESLGSDYRWSFITGGPENPNTCNNIIAGPHRINAVTAKSSEPSFPPNNAIDRDLQTKWISQTTLKPWIAVDLGGEIPICKVDIAWADGASVQYDFIISVSPDGTNFVKVFSGTSLGGSNSLERYSFTETTARYVRVMLSDDTDSKAEISELAVIGRY